MDSEWRKAIFTDEAAETWRTAFPHLPPGPEVVLWMPHKPCDHCGTEIEEGEIGAMDPEMVDAEGRVHGIVICVSCMEKGL